jgi:hypothetical protein
MRRRASAPFGIGDMNIDIYRSVDCTDKYLAVLAGTQLNTIRLDDDELAIVSPFKASFAISPGDKQFELDADDVIAQINANGHAVLCSIVTSAVAGSSYER